MTTSTRRRPKTVHTIVITERGRFTVAVSGPVRIVHPAIKATGIKWQWESQTRHYLIPANRVDDLAAALEIAGHVVELPPVTLW